MENPIDKSVIPPPPAPKLQQVSLPSHKLTDITRGYTVTLSVIAPDNQKADLWQVLVDRTGGAHLAAGVDVSARVADGDGAHHLAVVERVDLARVAWDARPDERVGRERHRLHLPVRTHVERVRPATQNKHHSTSSQNLTVVLTSLLLVHFLLPDVI